MLEMAYVDLVSSGVTPIANGGTYNFAFDTPVAADGSPHITHVGFQIDGGGAAAWTSQSTIGRLVTNWRMKVGSVELINFDDPFSQMDAATPSNLSCLAQKVGGVDYAVLATPNNGTTDDRFLGELSLPFALDASKSHRVNFSITLGNEATWGGQAFVPGETEFNVVLYYGRSTEQTVYGSRQDFDLTSGSIRTITVYGKAGYSMLGVTCINDSDEDAASEFRVNNGAFRALNAAQWRVLDGTHKGLRSDGLGSSNPAWILAKDGFQFIDLKRITAGSNIDIAVTAEQTTTASFFPVWVAPIGAKSGSAPKQTANTVSSTTATVESESAY